MTECICTAKSSGSCLGYGRGSSNARAVGWGYGRILQEARSVFPALSPRRPERQGRQSSCAGTRWVCVQPRGRAAQLVCCAALFLLVCRNSLGMCAAKGPRRPSGRAGALCASIWPAPAPARKFWGGYLSSATLCGSIGPTQRSAFREADFEKSSGSELTLHERQSQGPCRWTPQLNPMAP